MAAKICPFEREELRRMYEDEGMGTIAIASLAAVGLGKSSISHNVVSRWLRENSIPVRSCGRKKRPRQFTRSLLEYLYREKMLSLKEIAETLQPETSEVISASKVHVWLREYGIETRSYQRAGVVMVIKDPSRRQLLTNSLHEGHEAYLSKIRSGEIPHHDTKDFGNDRRKLRKATRSRLKSYRDRWITRKCDLPECNEIIERPPCRFRYEFAYHSNKCRDKDIGRIRQIKAARAAAFTPVTIPDIPDWLAEVREEFRAKHGTI